jgi:putative heme-binding domain-containing protein
MSLEQLLKRDRNKTVFTELLNRPGLRDELRREAVQGLAKLNKQSELEVLLGTIRSFDDSSANDEGVAFDLMRLLAARGNDLTTARGELERLATKGKRPVIRQFAFAALVGADGSGDKVWKLASQNAASLRDFVSAVPMISDAGVRASLYPQLVPLLDGLPESLGGAASSKGTFGRYVRIELPRNGTLTLAEVEVSSEGRNVARSGKAKQKNTAHGGDASRAIDGNKSSTYGDGGQTHTEENTANPWWEVDLGEEHPIDSIAVYNRGDGNLGDRLNGFTLKVLDGARNEVFKQENNRAPKPSRQFDLAGGGPGSLVRRAAMNALVSIRGQEAATFGKLAKFVREDQDRLAAIRALQRIPQSAWPKEEAQPLIEALIAQVKKIPAAERTSPAALDALQLADALTSLVPAENARPLRKELREIGVRVVRIGTLPERMAYDKEVLVIQAGKPVEFVFDNTDLMPHNFVILQQGALKEVGELAEATAQDPASPARQYVPPSNKILLASRLLTPRDSQKLSFQAPAAPGIYPYVCTFPGHWTRMHGALYVVEDLDAYLDDSEGYLAAAKLVAKDELLKNRRPRMEWKFEDLSTAVEHLEGGRSYATAKQMFTVASCTACHKMDGAGKEFGPDLTKLDAKYQPVDILKHVLEPSATINEKYQTYIFSLNSGKVVTGIILEETPDAVKVIENPLLKAEAISLKKTDIDERAKSPVSVMPKGLLDKLSREEVLDLIAYLTARGNTKHELFGEGHGHKH